MKLRTSTRVAFALLLFAAAPYVLAATKAGDPVKNKATVTYEVGGVAQTAKDSNTNSFVVDRKVDLTVTNTGNASGGPGDTSKVLTFTVQNNTNDTIDIILSDEAGTSSFASTNVKYFYEKQVTGTETYGGGETEGLYIPSVAEGDPYVVYIVADFPASEANGATDVHVLVAQAAAAGGSSASPSAALAETAAQDDPNVVENVFADAAGTNDVAEDGKHSAAGTYTFNTAALTVQKSYKVIWEDANGLKNFTDVAANAKPIPGALVEFCILVTNDGGSATSSAVVTDVLSDAPNNVATYATFQEASMRAADDCAGTNAATRSADDSDGDGSSWDDGTNTVTIDIGSVPADGTRAALFQVILN